MGDSRQMVTDAEETPGKGPVWGLCHVCTYENSEQCLSLLLDCGDQEGKDQV